ncbi:metal-dependent hydrolase [Saccharophagus degradans]|uniref:Metal-dependent hydrolase n=1 Tax=Saccharophagus degradans TaxID=86304 RepID=A0AAW7X892_9GAMM|nr:metal-dependent hydrolase [Saccharophagus degradans]MDO6423805.1 metal-dependent hydrolase [Saccharophagus degradans]MDO6607885.1 metal-dependent hydrolase [Saccharophagus degradans]WGO98751.1 metal-dependent hydrolase [Saccharophagus degradans]
MPFTPVHMGPGILLKAVLQGSFSLMVFGWAQIVMDIQPLLVLVTGEGHLHGFSHTYVGASLLAIFAAVTGKYLAPFGLFVLRIPRTKGIVFRWWVVGLSAFIGCFSHVVLDSIMHADMQPFYPFAPNNPMLKSISVEALHKLCLYSGLAGAAIYYAVLWFNIKRANN